MTLFVANEERSEQIDSPNLKRAFGRVPSGVAAVCALLEDGDPGGVAVSTFTPASLEPPLVSICMQNTSTTWPRLRNARALGVTILGSHQHGVARKLAGKSERFAGVDWTTTPGAGVLISGGAVWLETSLYEEIPAGDHLVALLEVQALTVFPEVEPLVFHASGFRELRSVADLTNKQDAS